MEKQQGVRIGTLIMTMGALISYHVGAGFASGNEVLQAFGSWGPDAVWALGGALAVLIIAGMGTFYICSQMRFESSENAYLFFGGKGFGRFVQAFTFVCLILNTLVMFAGAGTLLNQHLGWPQWMGSVIMGVVSLVVVLGGFKTLERVLGMVGTVILIYLVIFLVIGIFSPNTSMGQAAVATEAVKSGEILQINILAMPPFSWIPGLASHNTAVLTGMTYGSELVFTSFPFMVSLAKSCQNPKEAVWAAVVSSIGYILCVSIVVVLLLFNFDAMINPVTKVMNAFPLLAAIERMWPAASWTYAGLCFAGIFTTISGYLYATSETLFRDKCDSRQCKIYQVVLTIAGLTLGMVIPFSKIINVLFPVRGTVGAIMAIIILVGVIRFKKSKDIEIVEEETIEAFQDN